MRSRTAARPAAVLLAALTCAAALAAAGPAVTGGSWAAPGAHRAGHEAAAGPDQRFAGGATGITPAEWYWPEPHDAWISDLVCAVVPGEHASHIDCEGTGNAAV